jgi:hypothetical protein
MQRSIMSHAEIFPRAAKSKPVLASLGTQSELYFDLVYGSNP